ncbi:MAG TPA: bifunctional (p)ppGpp synthetase/guanosine-3',5'-bis(diphosphate) 3'-pyrophosphohydrolase [Terriglobia bacterium]|nr:bifunctional (p)ppGpp synthetase/guanosine-3',5'-bis(diphosphate) 3'-pyrophosphohydrolase [Terriglobia bacterium]
MVEFEEVLRKVQTYRPTDDLGVLRRAYEFSAREHQAQKRLSGEPYLSHPVEVANILSDMKLDVVCLAAGMLHDVVEDTPATTDQVRLEFGAEIAGIVEGVTKISRIEFFSPEDQQAENLRKMVLAMVKDLRVVLVKLADRLHNMRTLEHLEAEKQRRISRETLEIYAPIAHRLGMGKLRGELEDLAFKHLEPEAFQEVKQAVESRRKVSEEFLADVCAEVKQKIAEGGIPARIEGRIKRLYSIWVKLKRQQISIEQVYDLLAVRIITDSEKNCYGALGVVHNTWRPVPSRFKDFIAIPRPNLYQSLHTSVIGPNGQPFEVQIRTEEMHRLAEQGIAAHWKYKEKDGKPLSEQDVEYFAWLRHLVEWQQEMRDPGEFLSTLKVDLYPEEVYTFTPKGKVIVLPRDATPVDFAYAIHTEVGHHCTGAKVNGRIVPLKYRLTNGDIVEIVTLAGHNPSRDWLAAVKTSRARNKIKHWINLAERREAVEIGKKLLEKEARRHNVSFKDAPEDVLHKVAVDYGCRNADDIHAGIGYGKFSARQVLAKLFPAKNIEPFPHAKPSGTVPLPEPSGNGAAIKVHGQDDLMVYLAKCCNPIRGEAIVGYVTRGKGISVHSRSCPNVQNLLYDAERRMEVEWSGRKQILYPVKLTLTTEDRQGMLAEVTSVISDVHSNIQNIEARTGEERASIDVTLAIEDMQHLNKIVANLRKIEGVYQVRRVMNP